MLAVILVELTVRQKDQEFEACGVYSLIYIVEPGFLHQCFSEG